ncbi:3',5'-nucleoside bisphosphate phosphatase [bioreactor metagenome]|uniref:3',5'-nucleoside bisphosphate phosphatase n=1 Tax=bioreactor metagenome TaxID=1076179 RepID=A0A645ALW9_9ZZZZ|nr:PHP domain-containing protein [Erysipelotrichaceae bacterium]
MTNVDLHMHSIYSDDGEFTVRELFAKAQAAGLKLISITDHDTAEANYEAEAIAAEYDMTYIPGIEVSCAYKDIDLHVLGYGIDYRNPKWQLRYHQIVMDYNKIFYQIVDLLNAGLGVQLDAEQLISEANGKMVNGEAVCAFLLKNPNNINNPLLRPYFPGGERSDMPLVNFYWDFMSQGKFAYVPLQQATSLAATVKMIKDSHGFAVLAHPGQNLNGHEELLPEILAMGVVGMEVYTSYHDADQIAEYAAKANEFDCLVTYGSDFHGAIKPIINLGGHHGTIEKAAYLAELKKRALI